MSRPKQPKQCHYCEERATTRDHIVPRSLTKSLWGDIAVPDVPNTVPACYRCNQLKRDRKSTCECDRCVMAWAMYGPLNYTPPLIDVSALALAEDELTA